jgi:hypothetical protein
MQEHRLMVQPDLRLKSKRTPAGCKPKPTKPNGSWVIIMTKELVQSFVWPEFAVYRHLRTRNPQYLRRLPLEKAPNT